MPTRSSTRSRDEPSLKLAFLCSPNNPTGNADRRRPTSCASPTRCPTRSSSLDEAYIEFADSAEPRRRSGAAAEPRRAAHPVQGLWPGRRADRLRDRQCRADRDRRRARCRPTRCRACRSPRRWPRWRRRGGRSTRSGSRRIKADRERLAALLAALADRRERPQRRRQFPVPRSGRSRGARRDGCAALGDPRPLPPQRRAGRRAR